MTVLHIDDDADTRFLLRELAQAEAATSGGGAGPPRPDGGEAGEPAEIHWLEAGGMEEALARYSTSRPDVVLLDNRLGGQSGLDLLPSVRRVWSCPVWILTGFSPELLRQRAEECGAAGVISKDALLADSRGLRNLLLACCGSSSNVPIKQ